MSGEIAAVSPGLRRSPRFVRVPHKEQTGGSSFSPHRSLDPSRAEPQPRRIQFDDCAEPVSIPSSAGARQDYRFPTDGNNFAIDPCRSQAVRVDDTNMLHSSTDEGQSNNFTTQATEFDDSVGDHTVPLNRQSSLSQPHEVPAREVGAVVIDDEEAEHGAGKIRVSAANEMTQVFAFVSTLSVKGIRLILRSWEWRQSGKKVALVAKVMLHLQLAILSGKGLLESLDTHQETRRFRSWLRMRLTKDETYPVTIDRLPSEEGLIALLPPGEANEYRLKKASMDRGISAVNPMESIPAETTASSDPEAYDLQANEPDYENNRTNRVNNAATESTTFGINEFARLLITIRDDEDAKSAVIAMGQDLTRSQLDAGVTRGDFWTIVASRYNDPTNNRFLSLAGYVDDVDSSAEPLAHRTSTFLKDKFNDAKADFTQYVTRWSASGQNDPDRFRNFLPKLPSGDLNALGKRMMVMFACTRKGTPYEEAHFLNVCCKLIPGGAGRDEGSRMGSHNVDSGGATTQRRKRAQPDSDGVKAIATSLSKIASCYEGRRSNSEGSNSEKLLKDYSCRLKKIKILEDVVKKLCARPSEGSSNDGAVGEASLVHALKKLQRDVSKDLLSDTED